MKGLKGLIEKTDTTSVRPFAWLRSALLTAGLALTMASSTLRAHDGSIHSPADEAQPEANAEPRAPSLTDEEQARNYFTDLPLVTQDGESVRFYSDVLRDRVVLINFVYTNCDEACPVITQQLISVRNMLGERFGKEIFFVSISTDPDRDTPESMLKFAEEQGANEPGWIFLTGEKQYVNRIITKLGQYNPVPEQHSSLLLAGNVQTRHWMKLRPNEPMRSLVYKLNSLADESGEIANR